MNLVIDLSSRLHSSSNPLLQHSNTPAHFLLINKIYQLKLSISNALIHLLNFLVDFIKSPTLPLSKNPVKP